MSGFAEEQIAALRAPLARENVREREQAGRKLSYIEGWFAIAEANRIFGFDGWDRETVECRVVCERERKIGQQQRDGWQVGYVAKVRVTVKAESQIVREGTGYGSGIDVDLGSAHESAIKEAETDAMKRALMTFGNPFGLALYDKKQSEVEPAGRPAPAPAPPATNGKAPTDHPRRQEALDAYASLRTDLESAQTLKLVDAIIESRSAELALIKEVHEDSYYRLLKLATARRQEFFASA